jgi:hypothetical protein
MIDCSPNLGPAFALRYTNAPIDSQHSTGIKPTTQGWRAAFVTDARNVCRR